MVTLQKAPCIKTGLNLIQSRNKKALSQQYDEKEIGSQQQVRQDQTSCQQKPDPNSNHAGLYNERGVVDTLSRP